MKSTMQTAACAAIAAAMAIAVSTAKADIKDYEFQLVQPSVRVDPQAQLTVRLVNKTTGKPVPDAAIFATRLDMAPDGMGDMTTGITAMPDAEPGTYKFRANVSMAGRWQLSLGAKIQGEPGTIESKLVIKADK